ncbi:MAG: dehydrogenase, FAD-containing subunit [Acidobacteriales bacterium]|nr:dehydrogenase, FAD-containing subunit [Terriglobales bacterium]
MVTLTRDSDIRAVLLAILEEKYPDPSHDLILEEFGCNASRIDVAVVNGFLHGYEIKSDSDNLDRLAGQVDQYRRVFDFVTLVCGKKLISAARAVVPKWWGLQLAQNENGSITISKERSAKRNKFQDSTALSRMLWKDEALKCLRRHGHRHLTSKASAEQIWNETSRLLDVKTLAKEARLAIKARGGSGFVKQSKQDGDSCTTGSIALLDHYSANLAWLLSQLSPRRPD